MTKARRSQTSLSATPSRVVLKRRCAVYTRKSCEEGLDMEFNSLDAQRESCEAYIASQKAEGWVLVPDRYDDGGFSGGTLERPALTRLLADIEAGRIDIVVVYKIDRLSRSLMDFARLVEVFERKDVTFVSVTQQFSTTTSMGKLTLNILFSFAQFEREVIGERIRDKFAASRKKGMWMGGWAPLGYRVKDRKLVIDKAEAAKVRHIFETFAKTRSATAIVRELAAEGFVNRYGQSLDKGRIYKLLHNRVYIGEAVHKGTAYPGEHQPIIAKALWDKVQAGVRREPQQAWRQDPRPDSRPAQGPDLRTDRAGHVADPYPQGPEALPLLCQPGGHQRREERQPDQPGPGGRDRARRHRPASHPAPLARDHRRHLARRKEEPRRPHRGRGPRSPPLLRSRSGTNSSPPSRPASSVSSSTGCRSPPTASTSACAPTASPPSSASCVIADNKREAA